MARAYISHLVTDYEKWRPIFDARMPKLADVGVTVDAVFRDTADPNLVLVCIDSDRLVGEAFLQDPEIERRMRDAGVEAPFTVSWVE